MPLLVKLEKENFAGGPSWRHQAYMLAIGPLRAYSFAVKRGGMSMTVGPPPEVFDDPTIIDLEVLKASEQTLGQLLPPPGEGSDWIERAAERELKARLKLANPWLEDAPAMSLVPLASPGESKDAKGLDRRPYGVLLVLRPHPMFGPVRSDGAVGIPAAIWHEGFDRLRWRDVPWVDFQTGEPLRDVHVDWRPAGEQRRLLTYGEVTRKHFGRIPERVLGPDGEPATGTTYGTLAPAPTEVSIVRLIGREMNLLDRTGVTTNPEYSDYTDDRGWRRLVWQAVQIAGVERVSMETGIPKSTVRRFVQTGRTSKVRWARYFDAVVRLATKELAALGKSLPSSDEARLRSLARLGRRCHRCDARLIAKQRKWCSRCRSSSGVARSRQ
jgi:hypothetical protein